MECIKRHKINYWPTAAESPDLNLIEMVWHELKHHMRRKVKPTTNDELVNSICEFWSTVDPEKCTKYIGHLQKVIPILSLRGKTKLLVIKQY